MYLIFIIGTAGSGKSLLTSEFSNWLKLKEQNVIAVNLDPGVVTLPYTPDIDICEYVSLNQLMDKYNLGPNGALIMATDLIATKIELVREEIEQFNADYILLDTPGQMELFAFRGSGTYIVEELSTDPKAILYLFDSTFSLNPLNYVSNMFLASAVSIRFTIPMLHILSKIDLIPKDEVVKILDWGEDENTLEEAIEQTLMGTKRLMSKELLLLISRLGLTMSLIPISSKNSTGFVTLHAALTRTLSGGEERVQ